MSTSAEPDVASASEKQPIQLQVTVEKPQACVRQVVVTIPHAEVERYMKEAYDELVPEAQVPGFRPGRAPRKLVEKQFRDRVSEQVKGSLLMDSLSQVTESEDFSAISEPEFDYNAIEIPEEGDFKFQFTVEVRPEFPTPKWKDLKLTKPVESIEDSDVDEALGRVLGRYGTWEATDEPAEIGDRILLTATFVADGRTLSTMEEERVVLEERLSFSDGTVDDFGKLLAGIKEGGKAEGKVKISENAEDEAMRGQNVDVKFEVIEVQKNGTTRVDRRVPGRIGRF